MRRRDDLTIHNERIKTLASTINAVALGVFGLGVVRPLIDPNVPWTLDAYLSVGAGLFGHVVTHYVLGKLKREDDA